MPTSRFFLLSCIFFVFSSTLLSQGLQGIRTERWAGISAVHLNPAASNIFPKKWDVQLVGGHLYASTDYLFLKNTSLFDILSHPEDLRAVSDTLGETILPTNPLFVDFPIDQKRWYGVMDMRLDGPGFAWRFGDRHTLGLFTATRVNMNGYRIPGTMGYRYLDAVPWQTRHRSGYFNINGMAWAELGGHYSYRSPDHGGNTWGFGVNAKMIRVIQAGFARTNEAFDYIRNNRDSMTLTNGSWDIAFTNDVVNQTDIDQIKPRFNGTGLALDLGFNYVIPQADGDSPSDYMWQFGAALTDIGFAVVDKNVETHRIAFTDTIKIGLNGLNQITTADEAIKTLSALYLNDSTASRVGSSFTVQMPARLNLHVDYRILPHIYAHASVQQRLPVGVNTLRAPNVLAVTPRFESKWFSAFFPISISDWQHIRVGTAARLGVLTLGSDNLASIVGQKKWRGTDMYFMLKINAFNFKMRDRGLRKKDRTWRKIGCYDL